MPIENPIQPSDACTYKNYPLILPIGIRNSVFLVLLPLYGSLPFSPSPCTLLFVPRLELMAEILALRQQLAILNRTAHCLSISVTDEVVVAS